MNNEEKREITIDEMTNFILEKKKEKKNQNNLKCSKSINFKKDSEQKKNIITSLNDPSNPYSALFYNNILYNNYQVKMHYNDMQQGVPYLRIRKLNSTDLPLLTQGNNIEERIHNRNSSAFNSKRKKHIIILPSTTKEIFNKSSSRKKNNKNKDKKKLKLKQKFCFKVMEKLFCKC